jgi:Ca2+/Na+ antiporter
MAIGDILGSNICDILLATGSGAIIADFNVDPVLLYFDIPMLFAAISLTFLFLWTEKTLKRWEAVFLIGFYGFYAILKLSFFQY